nr:hypothetical protein TorRG33x02_284210 [Ipomoea batatas]
MQATLPGLATEFVASDVLRSTRYIPKNHMSTNAFLCYGNRTWRTVPKVAAEDNDHCDKVTRKNAVHILASSHKALSRNADPNHHHVTAKNNLSFLFAETRSINKNLTMVTRTNMANSFTLVATTSKKLVTPLSTGHNDEGKDLPCSCQNQELPSPMASHKAPHKNVVLNTNRSAGPAFSHKSKYSGYP